MNTTDDWRKMSDDEIIGPGDVIRITSMEQSAAPLIGAKVGEAKVWQPASAEYFTRRPALTAGDEIKLLRARVSELEGVAVQRGKAWIEYELQAKEYARLAELTRANVAEAKCAAMKVDACNLRGALEQAQKTQEQQSKNYQALQREKEAAIAAYQEWRNRDTTIAQLQLQLDAALRECGDLKTQLAHTRHGLECTLRVRDELESKVKYLGEELDAMRTERDGFRRSTENLMAGFNRERTVADECRAFAKQLLEGAK